MISSNSFFASSFSVCFAFLYAVPRPSSILHCCLHYFRYFMSQYFAAMWRACTEVRARLPPLSTSSSCRSFEKEMVPAMLLLLCFNFSASSSSSCSLFAWELVLLAQDTHTHTHTRTLCLTHTAYLFVRSFVFVLLNIVNNCPQAAFPLCSPHSCCPSHLSHFLWPLFSVSCNYFSNSFCAF